MSSPPSYKSFSSFPFLQEKTLGDIRPQGFQMLAPPSSSASPPFDSLPQIFYFNTFSYLLSQDIPFHACQCHFFFTTVLPFMTLLDVSLIGWMCMCGVLFSSFGRVGGLDVVCACFCGSFLRPAP